MKKAAFFSIVVLLGLVITLFGACSGDTDTEPTENGVIIRPAPIHEVDINIAESFPPQIFVYIQGGLSDGCTEFYELKEERTGNDINIEVTTQRPQNAECTQVYGYFEKNVNLGTDFVSGETYTVKVNDYTTEFTMQ